MSIELLLAYVVGIASSLTVVWLVNRRKRKLSEKVALWESEKQLVNSISSNGLNYLRFATQSIMYVIGLICIANIVPLLADLVQGAMPMPGSKLMELATWGAAAAIIFKDWRLSQLSQKDRVAEHLRKIDKKIDKVKEKMCE